MIEMSIYVCVDMYVCVDVFMFVLRKYDVCMCVWNDVLPKY